MTADQLYHWLGERADRVAWRHNTNAAFIKQYDKLMTEARADAILAGSRARARCRTINSAAR